MRSSSASAELTRQVEKSTPAADELHERRPVSSARGNWQFIGGTPRALTSFLSHRSHSVLQSAIFGHSVLGLVAHRPENQVPIADGFHVLST